MLFSERTSGQIGRTMLDVLHIGLCLPSSPKAAAVHQAVSRFRAANPRVFGSVIHGADNDGSDLDLLVDALPGATLFDLGGLQIELEEILGFL